MSEITRAIAARQTQVTQLQSEIDILQRAAGIVGPPAPPAADKPKRKRKRKRRAKAKPVATSQPAAKLQPKATPKPKPKRKPRKWTAAEKVAIGKRMKAYWAKRRKTRRASR